MLEWVPLPDVLLSNAGHLELHGADVGVEGVHGQVKVTGEADKVLLFHDNGTVLTPVHLKGTVSRNFIQWAFSNMKHSLLRS